MSLFTRVRRKIASQFTSWPAMYLVMQGCSYASLGSDAHRFVRADLLRALSQQMHDILKKGDIPVKLYITSEGVFADVGGILLNAAKTNRYY